MPDCALMSDANVGHLAEPASWAIIPQAPDLDTHQDTRAAPWCGVPCCSGQFIFISRFIRFLSGGTKVKSGL